MKRRIALIWAPILVVVALILPSSTLATTGYTFTVVDQSCQVATRDVYFRVRVTAAATTPANKLTIKSVSQRLVSGKWQTYYHWSTDKDTFTPNGTPHSADYSYEHSGLTQYHWRIVSVLKAYQGKHVLASKKLTSKAC